MVTPPKTRLVCKSIVINSQVWASGRQEDWSAGVMQLWNIGVSWRPAQFVYVNVRRTSPPVLAPFGARARLSLYIDRRAKTELPSYLAGKRIAPPLQYSGPATRLSP
jgi:hypothetical protein